MTGALGAGALAAPAGRTDAGADGFLRPARPDGALEGGGGASVDAVGVEEGATAGSGDNTDSAGATVGE